MKRYNTGPLEKTKPKKKHLIIMILYLNAIKQFMHI